MWKKYTGTMSFNVTHFFVNYDVGREKFSLTFFRIFVPFIAIVDVLSMGDDFNLLFSEKDTFIPKELMYIVSEYKDLLDILGAYLKEYNLTLFFYNNAKLIYVVFLVFLMFGFLARFSSLLALLLQLIIFKSFNELNYGYDQFLTMSLFYCFWFPVGKYISLDSYIFNYKEEIIRFDYIRVIQIHLCMVYFFAGISKALDPEWWNGMSLWRSISSVYNNYFTISPYVLLVVGIGTVLLETLYSVFIWIDKTRYIVLVLCMIMHITIAYMLDLYSFSAMLIIWNIAAFYHLKLDEIKN